LWITSADKKMAAAFLRGGQPGRAGKLLLTLAEATITAKVTTARMFELAVTLGANTNHV
jgi:hypothetical protein